MSWTPCLLILSLQGKMGNGKALRHPPPQHSPARKNSSTCTGPRVTGSGETEALVQVNTQPSAPPHLFLLGGISMGDLKMRKGVPLQPICFPDPELPRESGLGCVDRALHKLWTPELDSLARVNLSPPRPNGGIRFSRQPPTFFFW